MEIKVKTEGKWTIVEPQGRIDGHTAPEFESGIDSELAKGTKMLAVDLSNVDYMSSAGLRVLLATYKKLKADAGDMALINPKDNVAEVLEISGFSEIFNVIKEKGELG